VGRRTQWSMVAVALSVMAAAAGCGARAKGVYHAVQPGETVYRISKAYGVPPEEVAAANDLGDRAQINVGQRLFIPGASRELPVGVITPRDATRKRQWTGRAPQLAWPVSGGTVSSGFGARGRSFHDGIDINAPAGTPVRAAADGEVAYSDTLRGYGNVIILRHRDGFATVYAHNQRNDVRVGQRVRRGEVIGTVGASGRTTGPNLHFEVRQDNVARDPLDLLPPVEQVSTPAGFGRGG